MPKLAPFLLTLAFLFHAPAQADQVQLLDRGDQSLAAFYGAIAGAHASIDLATYVFESCDSVPKLLLNAMVEKARQGVHVRLLIDAYSLTEPTKSSLPAYLATIPNFELRYYNDAPSFLVINNNMRSHIKAFVVDGATYITGGRNMQDDYFGLGAKMNYADHDLLVSGRSAATAEAQFTELWGSVSLRPSGGGDPRTYAATCLQPNARDAKVADLARTQGPALLAARPKRSCAVTYALDRPDFDACETCRTDDGDGTTQEEYLNAERLPKKRMTKLFLDFVGATKGNLEIANQYYLPVHRQDDALATLRARHVGVDVLTNATGDITDPSQNQSFTCYIQSSAARTAVGTQRVSLLTSDGALGTPWSLSVPGAPWRIHAKSAIRDGRDVLVSSFNLDPRSYNTNLESGAVVTDCPDLANDLEASYAVLRAERDSDRSCAACAREIIPTYHEANASCGGLPDLY